MNSLDFHSHAALIAAFNSGVKFEVHYMGHQPPTTTKPIEAVKMIACHRGGLRVMTESSVWLGFRLSGEHTKRTWRLVASQGKAQALAKAQGVDPFAPLNSVKAPEPLLKRFLGGQAFYVPKTGEVLHEVTFKKDELIVTLKDPQTGTLRATPRYNHEGKHKYRPERSLVAGTPPKPKKAVKVAIYRHAYNNSLFVIREGEVIPNIRGINNAAQVGETTIHE
ncbi:hypothetical protein RSP795_10345 [Ralstonia solanacearum]|uniref:hypothetical protein n=1 Tax=Ralstonia solanacearum TaxID=305 RepID=UPI0007D75B00|nr:hypothetical protein [Ralstonia solanacearum]OAI62827.1 hypothetical protein RSP795_10345 [Ralstonia solanacearum]